MKAIIRYITFFCGLAALAFNADAQVPLLNSYPSASATIYLDFDGQYVTGTSWNWGGPIDAQPSTITVTAMQEIFNRVAEDYRPFNINVTTDSTVYSKAPFNKRMRVIITPTNSWYGNAGGVAYVGSFVWHDETPCWVFSGLLYNNTKWIAEAVSHEAGHTLGLHHQSSFDSFCKKTAEYSSGQGEGEIGWAPIMGVGYYKNVTTWHKGPHTGGCNTTQSDIDVIASRTGLKPDDHANSYPSATDVSILGTAFNVSGLVNQSGDTDVFRIMIPMPTNFKLSAIPQNVGSGNEGANIDIIIALLDADKDTIGVYNPSTLLSAGIDTNLNSGYYYLTVKGVGNINHSGYGSVGFYALNGQLANILPVHKFVLKGQTNNSVHSLSWNMIADEPLKEITVETSTDGRKYSKLVTIDPTLRRFQYQPVASKAYYRLKATTSAQEKAYYSNVIFLDNGKRQPATIAASIVNSEIIVTSTGTNNYRIYDGMGKLVSKGVVRNGVNYISLQAVANGIFYVQFDDGKASWTEKIVKY